MSIYRDYTQYLMCSEAKNDSRKGRQRTHVNVRDEIDEMGLPNSTRWKITHPHKCHCLGVVDPPFTHASVEWNSNRFIKGPNIEGRVNQILVSFQTR